MGTMPFAVGKFLFDVEPIVMSSVLENAPAGTVSVSPLRGSPVLLTVIVPPEGAIEPLPKVSNDVVGGFVPPGPVLESLHAATVRTTAATTTRRTRDSSGGEASIRQTLTGIGT